MVCTVAGLGPPVWGGDLDKVGRWAGLCPLMGSGKQVVCITLTCSLSWAGKLGHRPVVTRGRGPRGQLASPGGSDGLSTTCGGWGEVGGASTPWGNRGGQRTPRGLSRAAEASSGHFWALPAAAPRPAPGAAGFAVSESTAGLKLVSDPTPTPGRLPSSKQATAPGAVWLLAGQPALEVMSAPAGLARFTASQPPHGALAQWAGASGLWAARWPHLT